MHTYACVFVCVDVCALMCSRASCSVCVRVCIPPPPRGYSLWKPTPVPSPRPRLPLSAWAPRSELTGADPRSGATTPFSKAPPWAAELRSESFPRSVAWPASVVPPRCRAAATPCPLTALPPTPVPRPPSPIPDCFSLSLPSVAALAPPAGPHPHFSPRPGGRSVLARTLWSLSRLSAGGRGSPPRGPCASRDAPCPASHGGQLSAGRPPAAPWPSSAVV